MPIISTFEILLKPQLPTDLPPNPNINTVKNLGRNVLQGYFLTVANLNLFDIDLSLVFTTQLPAGVALSDIAAFVDISGVNTGASLQPVGSGNKFRFSPLSMPAKSTALFILQPLPTDQAMKDLAIEARGFVNLELSSFSGCVPKGAKVQVTPEQRGTFFSNAEAMDIKDRTLDQVAYGCNRSSALA